MNSKDICKELKSIRRSIAQENHIDLDIPECDFHGHCPGTCPRCELEAQILEQKLAQRLSLGKIATVAGIALTLAGPLAASNASQEPPQTLPSSSLIATPDSNFLFRFEIQDSVSKEPIVFANILVKKEGKTINGATTNFDGRASIVVPRNDTYDIEISMVGYHKLTLANIEPTPSDDTSFVKLQLCRSSQTTIGLIQAEAVGKIYESDDAEQTIDTSSAVKVESLRHKRKHTLRNQNK